MPNRSYTVTEIDDLRQAVETKWLFGTYRPTFASAKWALSRSCREEERAAAVEQMVRTHMLAGHTAADLYASEADPS